MGIAITLQEYLDREGVHYELVEHPYTGNSMHAAEAAHVPGDLVAKSVVLEDDQGYLMAVVPATHRVALGKVHRELDRMLGLATEDEVAHIFSDCDRGAAPAVGQAYGMDVMVDDRLLAREEVYFEAGDHRDLVHVRGDDFRSLMHDARHGQISRHI